MHQPFEISKSEQVMLALDRISDFDFPDGVAVESGTRYYAAYRDTEGSERSDKASTGLKASLAAW